MTVRFPQERTKEPKIYGICDCCDSEIEEGDEILTITAHGNRLNFCVFCFDEKDIYPGEDETSCACCGKTIPSGMNFWRGCESFFENGRRSTREHDFCESCVKNRIWRAEV